MMLYFAFLIFLAAGMIQELGVIYNKKPHLMSNLIYTVGTLVFLLSEQPYVIHGFLLALVALAIFKNSWQKSSEITYLKGVIHYRDLQDEEGVRQEEDNNMKRMARIERIDAIISLMILIALAFHAFVFLIRS